MLPPSLILYYIHALPLSNTTYMLSPSLMLYTCSPPLQYYTIYMLPPSLILHTCSPPTYMLPVCVFGGGRGGVVRVCVCLCFRWKSDACTEIEVEI